MNRRCLLSLALLVAACSGRALQFPSGGGPVTGGGAGGPGGPGGPDLGGPGWVYPNDLGYVTPDFGLVPDMAQPPDMSGPPSTAPCLTGGSIIYLDGDAGDWIHPGVETIHVDKWSTFNAGSSDTFWYGWSAANLSEDWSFAFSSVQLGKPLAVGRYDGATRYPFESPGQPGIDITGSGRGCNTSSGWFQIHSLAGGPDNGSFTELTATFEQHCEDGTPALRGCIHFESN